MEKPRGIERFPVPPRSASTHGLSLPFLLEFVHNGLGGAPCQ